MRVSEIIDQYFLEHRAKTLDLAAFLDRHDRAAKAEGLASAEASKDVRVRALLRALDLLRDGHPERARRILELWSDHSTAPIPAAPMKGAIGAVELP
ncbi:MAG: hypothetical protein EXS03_08425 [Phycisphaerales bacterium]|nr:hypothetical protein [Phycisphaerales bacterium]